jgi:hypothetical protein
MQTDERQGSFAPFAFLGAPGISSGQTLVHAVEEPWLPLENLSADAPGAAILECTLMGGTPLMHVTRNVMLLSTLVFLVFCKGTYLPPGTHVMYESVTLYKCVTGESVTPPAHVHICLPAGACV